MRDTLRLVRAQEYEKLWQRVPGSLGGTIWILSVAIFGWDTGIWLGCLITISLTILARIIPSSSRVVEILVDICYYTVMRTQALRILWLLLIVDLWLAQGRGMWAIPMALAVFLVALIVPFATRRLLVRPVVRILGNAT